MRPPLEGEARREPGEHGGRLTERARTIVDPREQVRVDVDHRRPDGRLAQGLALRDHEAAGDAVLLSVECVAGGSAGVLLLGDARAEDLQPVARADLGPLGELHLGRLPVRPG